MGSSIIYVNDITFHVCFLISISDVAFLSTLIAFIVNTGVNVKISADIAPLDCG
jgi:hypothetical protein